MRTVRWFTSLLLTLMFIFGAVPALAESVTYSYDALGRLVQSNISSGPEGGINTAISYDAAGNRINYAVVGVRVGVFSVSAAPAVTAGSPLVYTVILSGAPTTSLTVNFATTNGTAVAGTDYTTTSGTLTFAVGTTTQTISVPTASENATGSKIVLVNLTAPSGSATISTSQASGTINYVATPPIFSISAAPAVTSGSPLVYTVTKTGTTISAYTVNYATANGTAVAGTDYTATSGTLTFAAGGNASQTISVLTTQESTSGSKTVLVNLSSPSGGATIATAQASGPINYIWTSTLTSGNFNFCLGTCISYTGYSYSGPAFGSMSSTLYNGLTINSIYTNSNLILLTILGSSAPPNLGWASITIPGVGVLTRASATYSSSGKVATWQWSNSAKISSGTVIIQ